MSPRSPEPNNEPAPFFWIGLKEPPQQETLTSHDSFSGLCGRLMVELEVISEFLYVGSGNILVERNRSYHAFARHNGGIILPGASLKGSVRGIAEAISNSCVRQVKTGESNGKHRECREIHFDNETSAKLCPACRLFGTTGYRGRVHMIDAAPTTPIRAEIVKIADLWPPRVAKGRKFYHTKTFQRLDDEPERNHRFVEAVPKGSRFVTSIFFNKTTPAEMNLLIRALGIEPHPNKPDRLLHAFPTKMGGAKPRCLGAVEWTPKALYLLPQSGANFFAGLAAGGNNVPLGKNLLAWLMDETLLDLESWAQFRKQARPMADPCPKEMY